MFVDFSFEEKPFGLNKKIKLSDDDEEKQDFNLQMRYMIKGKKFIYWYYVWRILVIELLFNKLKSLKYVTMKLSCKFYTYDHEDVIVIYLSK